MNGLSPFPRRRFEGWGFDPPLSSGVFFVFELPRMDIVLPCPDAAAASLRIFQRIEIALIRLIAIKYPSPAVKDHFELYIPPFGTFRDPGKETAQK